MFGQSGHFGDDEQNTTNSRLIERDNKDLPVKTVKSIFYKYQN
jgi:hypothetical protein